MNRVAGSLAALLWISAAHAAPLELVYDGYLSAEDTLNGVPLGVVTPFEVRSVFESSAPLAVLEPGGDVYAPSTFSLTLGGVTYGVTTVQQNRLHGQAIVLFDKTSPDANSPAYGGVAHYGVGFFSLGGGNVGVIGDWLAASPDVTVTALTPTTFNQFYGVGYNPGPITLTVGGVESVLVLNDAPDYNSADPGLTFFGSNIGSPTIADNQVSLLAVPEPRSWVLLAAMLGMATRAARSRRS